MKTVVGKTMFIYLLGFSLISGIAILGFRASTETVIVNVEIEPDKVYLNADYPEKFTFTLWFSGKYKNYSVSDIDLETLMINNIPVTNEMIDEEEWNIVDNTLTFSVDGKWFVDVIIWQSIYHIGRLDPHPEKGTWFPYKIDVRVSGQFYDGTPFAGTEVVKAFT